MIDNQKCRCSNAIILDVTTFNDAGKGIKICMCKRCGHTWEEKIKERKNK